MKTLIVEDDFIARRKLEELFSPLGECDFATNGDEAVNAFRVAHDGKCPYDLIFMDIMMPPLDGSTLLEDIRDIERELGVACAHEVRVIMTTALEDPKNLVEALYRGEAISYLVKPLNRQKLLKEIRRHGLM